MWIAYRWYNFDGWWIFGLTLGFSVLLQIAANCFDDYFDEGTHFAEAITSLILAVLVATIVIFWTSSYWLLPFGALCILSLLFYSGGPKPIGDTRWGTAVAFLIFGPICGCGSFYIFTHQFDVANLIVSVTLGGLIALLLVLNHYRDIAKDLRDGRVTVATKKYLLLSDSDIDNPPLIKEGWKDGKEPSLRSAELSTGDFSLSNLNNHSCQKTSFSGVTDKKSAEYINSVMENQPNWLLIFKICAFTIWLSPIILILIFL
jgi:hypothetical protein